jgi:uncharacterized protein (UPF0303 family)
MNLDKYISTIEKQEAALCFPHFNRQDAWELGQILATRILSEKLALAASIRLSTGFVLFQYAAEGSTLNNENWIIRKSNVVRDMGQSSLLYALQLAKKKQTLESKGLDPRQYALSGGGFPIRVANTGLIGAVVVSGLPHIADHNFVVQCLADFLKLDSTLPSIPLTAKI